MKQLFAYALAATVVAFSAHPPGALAQDQKKEQVHKGTPAQGSVQEHKTSKKKDGTGKAKAADKK